MKKIKIGFFDSGLGGTTIFIEALNRINADYVYFGDNFNAPYGIKEKEEVKKYVFKSIEELIKENCNIIVVACNTATSIAIDDLRNKYPDLCIIGTEPAIKVAVDSKNFKRALICATTLTIKEKKLNELINKLNIVDNVDMLALDKLVKFIESGNYKNNKEINKYLTEKLSDYDIKKYSHLVLGCTHFPILKDEFIKILGKDIKIIDGSKGIVDNIQRNILNMDKEYFSRDIATNIELILSKESKEFVNKFENIIQRKIDKLKVL